MKIQFKKLKSMLLANLLINFYKKNIIHNQSVQKHLLFMMRLHQNNLFLNIWLIIIILIKTLSEVLPLVKFKKEKTKVLYPVMKDEK